MATLFCLLIFFSVMVHASYNCCIARGAKLSIASVFTFLFFLSFDFLSQSFIFVSHVLRGLASPLYIFLFLFFFHFNCFFGLNSLLV